jgi:hypothetical protein
LQIIGNLGNIHEEIDRIQWPDHDGRGGPHTV